MAAYLEHSVHMYGYSQLEAKLALSMIVTRSPKHSSYRRISLASLAWHDCLAHICILKFEKVMQREAGTKSIAA